MFNLKKHLLFIKSNKNGRKDAHSISNTIARKDERTREQFWSTSEAEPAR